MVEISPIEPQEDFGSVPKPPDEKESAATGVGARRGAIGSGKQSGISRRLHRAIARANATALVIGPDENGALPPAALAAIDLLDELEPDPEAEEDDPHGGPCDDDEPDYLEGDANEQPVHLPGGNGDGPVEA